VVVVFVKVVHVQHENDGRGEYVAGVCNEASYRFLNRKGVLLEFGIENRLVLIDVMKSSCS
jgi:hypothetical protein